MNTCPRPDDDDVFHLFLQKQKRGAELHIYLEEGTPSLQRFLRPVPPGEALVEQGHLGDGRPEEKVSLVDN